MNEPLHPLPMYPMTADASRRARLRELADIARQIANLAASPSAAALNHATICAIARKIEEMGR